MGIDFSDDPSATGFLAPMRFEADIHDCEVQGDIPLAIDGTFYRACFDRRYPKRLAHDIPFNDDGAIDMFRFRGGHVDFRSRYVRTPRYQAERQARRALFGVYRNRSTNDPLVAGHSLNTANTTPIVHAGKLFAMKEDSPPTWLDPHTLKTHGEWTFGGKMTAKTFTAHPKIDPVTGEMIAFAYEGKGDLTDDVAVYVISPNGEVTNEFWIKAPVVSMMHDFAITSEHVILPTTGMVTSAEQLAKGEVHWRYDASVPSHVGIVRRDGDGSDIRWFKGNSDQAMLVHTANARTEGSRVILDCPVGYGNFNPQFKSVDDSPFDNEARKNTLRRWTFDLDEQSDRWTEEIMFDGMRISSFVRIDDRFITRPFRYAFDLVSDPAFPFDHTRAGSPVGLWGNCWYRFDYQTDEIQKVNAGPVHGLFEPQFVPRSDDAPEGDGFLIGVASNYETMKSELIIVDAMDFARGVVARVKLPFRLHTQVHGWWASAGTLAFEFDHDEFA